MKIQFNEYDSVFSLDLTAETLEDAALLVRFGLNTTNKINYKAAYVSGPGFFASLSLPKTKRSRNTVK